MILIVSDPGDQSTNSVIDWINSYHYPFLRVNQDARFRIMKYSPSDPDCSITIEQNNDTYDFKDIGSIWYRRGEISFKLKRMTPTDITDQSIRTWLNTYLLGENETIAEALLNRLKIKKSLNSLLDVFINKLLVLEMADRVGLKIPDTIVTSSQAVLYEFKHKHGRIICKAARCSPQNPIFGYLGQGYTAEVFDFDIQAYGDSNRPTVVQELIPKLCDIRLFYMNGRIFPSAIFSQYNTQTKIDFRKYDDILPNRVEPMILPQFVESKIKNLMNGLDMNSGSIDMILSKTGEYVFLEVNPVGQFAQVSYPCNYYIEREIAKILIEDDKRWTKDFN